MSLNIKLLLDKRRARKDGSYPLIMRILYDRKSTNIPLGYSLLEKDWDDKREKIKSSAHLSENPTRLNNYIHKQRTKAYDLFTKLEDEGLTRNLDLTEVKKIILGKNEPGNVNVFAFIDEIMDDLKRAKKYGNAAVYQTLRNKLKAYLAHERLTFADITYKFLKKLESAHYAGGASTGSLSVYMRTLRATYNKAVKAGLVHTDKYPFKDYKIKNQKPVRKALSEEDFNKFKAVKLPAKSSKEQARRLFMASFYLRGMNWMDMAYLKVSNISGDFERVAYVRRKTGEPFNIKIHPKLKEIMHLFLGKKWRNEDFVFPILSKGTPEENVSG